MAEYNKICKYCAEPFTARRYDIETCSIKCSQKWQYLKKKKAKKEKIKVRDCVWCGTQFLPKKNSKMTCSTKCHNNYKYNLEKGNLEKFNIDKTKACVNCRKEKKLSEFERVRKSFVSMCKVCVNEYYDKKLNDVKLSNKHAIFFIIDDFIKEMKSKAYYAEQSDIFRLISLYDELFPTSTMPEHPNQEYIFNMVFAKLVDWHRKEKKSIINSEL